MMLRFPNKVPDCRLIVRRLQDSVSDNSKFKRAESPMGAGLWQTLARHLEVPAITFAPTNRTFNRALLWDNKTRKHEEKVFNPANADDSHAT